MRIYIVGMCLRVFMFVCMCVVLCVFYACVSLQVCMSVCECVCVCMCASSCALVHKPTGPWVRACTGGRTLSVCVRVCAAHASVRVRYCCVRV